MLSSNIKANYVFLYMSKNDWEVLYSQQIIGD